MRSLRKHALVFFLIGLGCAASAQTITNFYWTNSLAGAWRTIGNWTNGAPATGGGTNYILNFTTANTTTASTNDFTSFQLNQLIFSNVAATLYGNDLTFTNNGATLPLINQNGASNIVINNNLILATNLTFAGTGASNLTVNGLISGNAAITKSGNYTILLTTNNAYTGPTLINAGTLQLGTGNALTTTTALTLGDITGVGNLNLGAFSQSVASFNISSTNTSTNTITIAAGQSLTVNGNVIIGQDLSVSNTTKLTFVGSGSFLVNTNGGLFQVSAGNTYTNGGVKATVDMSALATATINLGPTGQFQLGDLMNTGGTPFGDDTSTLTLASNTAITANSLTLGGSSRNKTLNLNLGSGANLINANLITLGGTNNYTRDLATLQFTTTTGSLTIRAADGVSRAALLIGVDASGTGFGGTDNLNLTNHTADLLLSTLTVGENNRHGTLNSNFSFNQGTLDTTALRIGNRPSSLTTFDNPQTATVNLGGGTVIIGSNGITMATTYGTSGTSNNTAILNISGGTVIVSNTITLLTQKSNLNPATGTLNLTGGSLTVLGDILIGTNTGTAAHTATLTLNGGTLDLQGHRIGTASSSNNIDVLNFQAGTLLNVAQINNGAALTKTTTGLLTLDGLNSYTGGTIINAGNLQFTSANALPATGSITINTNAALLVAGPFTTVTDWLNSNRIATNSAGALALVADSAEPIDLTTLGGGSYSNLFLGATTNVTYSGTLTPLANTYRLGGGGGTLTVASALTGNYNVVFGGPGTVFLTGPNTYTGSTTISNTTLAITDDSNLGAAPATPQTNIIFTGTGTLQANAPAITLTNTRIIAINTGVTGIFDTQTNNLTINGPIVGPGNLTKTGTGTLLLNNTNTYTGGTTLIAAGTLQLGAPNILPASTIVTQNTATVFDLNGNNQTINILNTAAGSSLLLTSNAVLTINASGSAGTYSGLVSGTGALIINMPNTTNAFTIATNSTYSGGTTITGGRASITTFSQAFGSGPVTATNFGQIFATGGNITNALTISGTGFPDSFGRIGALRPDGATFSGPITLVGSTRLGTFNAIGTLTGNITDNGSNYALELFGWSSANCALFLTGSNTYSGGTTLSNMTVRVGTDNALGSGPILATAGSLSTLTATGTLARTLANSLILSNDLILGTTTTHTGTLTINGTVDLGAASRQLTVSSTVFLNNAITNGINLTKSGSGLLVLAGANTYTGSTLVTGGILRADYGIGIPTASAITFSNAVWESNTTITNTLGTATGQLQLPGGAAGFSAVSNPITVNLNSDFSTIVWGTNLFNPSSLVLNTTNAVTNLTFSNNLDLNGVARTVTVNAATAIISGVITDSVGTATLVKAGAGTLALTAVNTFTNGTTISAGTLNINNDLALGPTPASAVTNLTFSATGTLQAGASSVTINSNRTIRIAAGTATLDDTGGTFTINSIVTGNNALTKVGTGTVTLNGATNILAAVTARGGTLTFNGPTVSSGTITAANATADRSTLIIATNLTAVKLFLGNATNSAGAVIQTGGTVTLTSAGNLTVLGLGSANGGYGYYRLLGGALFPVQLEYGATSVNGVGVFDQFAGTVAPSVWNLTARATNSVGIVNVYGGTMYNGVSNNFTMGFQANVNAFGMLNVLGTGVMNTTTNAKILEMMGTAGNLAGVVNLLGGTLIANKIQATSKTAPSLFSFNGGLLQANPTGVGANGPTFLTGLTAATVYPNGAFIDSSTNIITIGQNLLAPAGYGITAINFSDGGANYIGAPAVLITGGIGTGATAIAQVDLTTGSPTFGQITNLLVTSAGFGYGSNDILTATLLGGGALQTATVSSVSLGLNNNSGALTKLGTGTLILTGTNNYGGGTIVSNGTLQGSTVSLQGAITNASAVVFDQTFTGTFNGTVSGTGSLTKQNTGTVIFTNFNTYTGPTFITGGVLRADLGVGLPTTGNVTLSNAILETAVNFTNAPGTAPGQFQITGGTAGFNAYTNAISVGAAGTTATWGTSSFNPTTLILNTATASNTITFLTSLDLNGTSRIIQVAANVATISGVITDSLGGAGLIVTGPGTLALTAANGYTGPTTVTNATLNINADAALGLGTGTNLIIRGTGTLQAGAPVISINAARTLLVTNGATANLDDAGNSLTFNGPVVGAGTVNKIGSGTVTLAGTNTPAILNVLAGSLQLLAASSFTSANAAALTVGGNTSTSTLYITGSTVNLSGTANLAYAGNTGALNGQIIQDGGTFTSAGAVRLAANTNITYGSYTLSNGVFNLTDTTNGWLQIGRDGVGLFNQLGGTVTLARASATVANGSLMLAVSTGSTGSYNLQSGSLYVTNGSGVVTGLTSVAGSGTGTLSLSGPSAIANFNGAVIVASSGGTGVVNATAGELRFNTLMRGTNTTSLGTLTWSGATLRPYNVGAVVSNNLPVVLNGPGATFNTIDSTSIARTSTIFSAISESGGSYGINITGNGVLILAGTNTFTGGLTVSNGVLIGTTFSLLGSISNNGAVVFDQNFNGTFNGTVSGTGSLTKQNTGLVIFTNANSYSGNTYINGGTLRADLGVGIPATSPLLVISNGTFETAADFTGAFQLAGTNATFSAYTNPVTINYNSQAIVPLGSTTLTLNASNAPANLTFANGLNLGSLVHTVAVNGAAATISGLITNGDLVKAGPGVLVLTGTNAVTDPIQIVAGILAAEFGTGLPSTTNITITGGSLASINGQITNSFGTGPSQINIPAGTSGFSAYNVPTLVNIGNGTTIVWSNASFNPATLLLNDTAANAALTLANKIDLAGSNVTRTITVNSTVPATISGIITNSNIGLATLAKDGTGTLILTATNSYNGGTTIVRGTLQLGNARAVPNNSTITFGDGVSTFGTLDVSNSSPTFSSLQIPAPATGVTPYTNSIINLGPGQTLTVSTNAVANLVNIGTSRHLTIGGGGNFTVNDANGTFLVWGWGPAANTPTNAFVGLDLSRLANFTATVTNMIVGYDTGTQASRSGILILATNNTITAPSIYLGQVGTDGGVVGEMLLGQSNTINVANLYLGYYKAKGIMTFADGFVNPVLNLTGTNGTRANVSLGRLTGATGATPTGYLMITNTGASINANIDTLLLGSIDVNPGTASASAHGFFTFNAGTVNVNTAIVARCVSGATTGTLAEATLTMNGGSFTVNNSFIIAQKLGTIATTGTVIFAGGTAAINANLTESGGVSTVTLSGGSLDMLNHSIGTGAMPIDNLNLQNGTLANVAQINGGSNVVKTGTGNLILTGINNWTGATIVSNGTLSINGQLPNSAVTVTSGATLGGTGFVAQALNIQAGATLAPGNSIGTLTVSNLTLAGTLNIEITSNAVDLIAVINALDISSSNSAVNFVTLGTLTSNIYTFATYNTLTSNNLATAFATANNVPTGYAIQIDDANKALELVQIPEPNTLTLVALGLAAALVTRRRKTS